MKDNFSAQASLYAQYRPTYPKEWYEFLMAIVPARETAWDCATGNGQIAGHLCKYIKTVYATDLSEKQVENAVGADNIFYKVEAAEHTAFPSQYFDLITVGQAIHWLQFDQFYREVKRVAKPGGILAIVGYNIFRSEPAIDSIIDRFYFEITGPYWDKERRYVDEQFRTIPFPFEEIPSPTLVNTMQWTFENVLGFLNSWSAVEHYKKKHGTNPVDLVYEELRGLWPEGAAREIKFPILMRTGRVS
jgi:ubiquinone/menaquinone biosynthesis C-methylase UbiE